MPDTIRASYLRSNRLDGSTVMSCGTCQTIPSNLKSYAVVQVILLVVALVFGPAWCAARCASSSCEKVVQAGPMGTHDAPCHHTSHGKHNNNGVQQCARSLYFHKQNSTAIPNFSSIFVFAEATGYRDTPELTRPSEPKRSWPPGIAFQAPSILRI